MARSKSESLTAVEKQIMEVLWAKEQASARDITTALNEHKKTAFTTVQTMCKVLLEKGYVDYHKEGRAFVYTPLITQEQARSSALNQLITQFFADSPKVLAEHLLQANQLNIDDLDELQRQLDARKQSKNSTKGKA